MNAHDPKVILRDDSGREAPGHLLGIPQSGGEGRVCVVLDEGRGLVLALGGDATLELVASDDERGARVRGRVLQHRVGRDAGWYVLEIDASDRPLLTDGADRRKHLRGRPAASAPIAAQLSAPDGSRAREASIKDLSEGGAGVLVRPPEDLELLAQPRLRVSFLLGDGGPPAEVLAHLVFRRQSGSLLHYGVAFDALATSGFDQTRVRLAAWVLASQAAQQRQSLFPSLRAG